MTAPGSPEQVALVGIPQIARIADVGTSAVGNWRKRYADFPTPRVQTPSGALFDLDEIERWLVESGKIAGRVPSSVRLWALADIARGAWRPEQFASFCVAVLVYLEACEQAETGSRSATVVPAEASWAQVRDNESPAEFVRCLQQAAGQIEALNPPLVGLLTPGFSHLRPEDGRIARSLAVALDEASDDTTMRFELLDEVAAAPRLVRQSRRGQLSGDALANLVEADRFTAAYSTPDDLCYLVSQLVATTGGVIFDPAAGEGGLLLLAALWRYHEVQPTLVGVEIDEAVQRITRSRCYLYDIPADIRLGNALTMDLAEIPKADSLVLDPPYGVNAWGDADVYLDPRWLFGPPPPSSADFAWLQIAALHLKTTGRAGVILPIGTLSRGGREAAIRRAMIDAGVVEGVVLLPPRLRADTSIQLAIWLLRSPDSAEPSNELLLVDASGLGKPGRSRFSLEEQVIDRLGNLVETWRARRAIKPDDIGIAMAVPATALVDADLDPRRYRNPPQLSIEAMEGRVHELRRTVRADALQVQRTLTSLIEQLGSRQ